MSDLTPHPETDDNAITAGADRGQTRISRWQKVVAIIGLVVLLGVGARMVGAIAGDGTGPGGHGPPVTEPATEPTGDEPAGEGGGHTPPPGTPEHGEQQP